MDAYISENPSLPLNSNIIYDEINKYYKTLTINQKMLIVFICCLLIYISKYNFFISLILISFVIIFVYIYQSKILYMYEVQKSLIYPKSKFIEKHNDILTFLFTIQEFYDYSPQNYLNMIIHIDKLLSVYEDILIDNKYAGLYYDSITEYKNIALVSLQNILYKLPDDKTIIKKYNESKHILEKLLNKYIDKVIELNTEYNIKNNIDVETKFIHKNDYYSYNEPFGREELIYKNINSL